MMCATAGVLQYNQGQWHDGLVLVSEGVYRHRTIVEPGSCNSSTAAAAAAEEEEICSCVSGAGETFMCKSGTTYVLDSSTLFYVCPCQDCCSVGKDDGNVECVHNTAGLLCTKCRVGYYKGVDDKCYECTADDRSMTGVIAIAVVLSIVGAVFYFVPGASDKVLSMAIIRKALTVQHHLGVVTMVKLVFSFYQVVLLIQDIYDVPYPQLYLDFLKYFHFFVINMFQLARADCIEQLSYYDMVLILGGCMVTAEVVALCCMAVRDRAGGALSAKLKARLDWWSGHILIGAYFFYSPVSAKLFATFNCRPIDGGNYLHEDYALDCDAPGHARVIAIVWVMVLTVAAGLPMIYFATLYNRRHNLEQESHFGFFIRDYVPSMWWWEVAECFKRLLLVGGAVFLPRGSLMQIGFAINVVVLYLIALLVLRPFKVL